MQKTVKMTESIIDVKGNKEGEIKVTLENLGIATKKRGRSYTIFCPSLKVLGYSKRSEKAALRDFEKNLAIFFNVHIAHDTLHEALIGFDWIKENTDGLFGSKNNSPVLKTKNFNLSLGHAA